MKIKKLSVSMKFVIAVLAIVILSMAAIGVSRIFAEPTIQDLVQTPEIGTFEPSSLYVDDENAEIKLVAYLNTTLLMFSYDRWIDTSGDGLIDAEDVYSQDGFEHEMMMETVLYPILETEESGNYYVVAFPDYYDYDGVVVQLQVSENNDFAQMKDASMYWFDSENNYLYIDKNMIQKDIELEYYTTIRSETIILTKNINDVTRTVDLYTVFDEKITDTHGLARSTPNGAYKHNMMEWNLSGLQYQLVQPTQLVYVSAENLTVYVNYAKMEPNMWSYDETTGMISINCSPYTTSFVAVEFNELNDTTAIEQTLQYFQSVTNSETGQCAESTTLDTVLTGYNPFLNCLQYDDNEPQVGAYQELDFTVYAELTSWTTCRVSNALNYSVQESVIKSAVDSVLVEWYNSGKLINKADTSYGSVLEGYCYTSPTLSANIGYDWDASLRTIMNNYGNVVYNLFLEHTASDGNLTHLHNAVAATESLLTSVDNKGTWSATTNLWLMGWRYITGSNGTTTNDLGETVIDTSFLGGTVPDGSNAFFDVSCACIVAPSADAYAAMNNEYGAPSNQSPNFYDYRANATIIDVAPNSNGNGGDLFVCVWSQTMTPNGVYPSQEFKRESQRLLAFSKIAYTYNGSGKITLTKTDSATNEAISGAQYTIYKDAGCTQAVETVTTSTVAVESSNLPAGKYYVKETAVPTGYLRDTRVYEVDVVGGATQDLKVQDQPQNCNFSLTVYDQTTENATHKVPVPGIKFELLDPGGTVVNDNLVTDTNGKISGTVSAIGDYTLRQMDTVINYTMEDDPNSAYYCYSIPIEATPTQSGNDLTCTLVHYEQRQSIALKSHVQDENLLANTPYELGGEAYDLGGGKITGSFVSLVGAKYQLRTTSQILLGYYNGTPVTVDANEVLSVRVGNSNTYSTEVVSRKDGNKAYLVVERVQVTHAGKLLDFPLPNGQYRWELLDVSPGYYDNAAITEVDAGWKTDNNHIQLLDVNGYPVKQVRQKVEITHCVKSYVKNGRETDTTAPILSVMLRDNALTRVLSKDQTLDEASPMWMRFVDPTIKKTVTSNKAITEQNSVVNATLYENSTPQYAVVSSGVVPNAIYTLTNLCDIVDIETGKIVEAYTQLGLYQSNSEGKIEITKLGTEGFDNPNKQSNYSHFGGVFPQAMDDGSVVQGDLPNGIYALVPFEPADGYKAEKGLSEDIVFSTQWTAVDSGKDVLTASAVTFLLNEADDPVEFKIPTAPDVPIDKADPYDPVHPDDSVNNPDDSNDIEIVTKEWVDNNQYNLSYRIVDSTNVAIKDEKLEYDVNDSLPVTFAFYLNDESIPDEISSFKYNLSFYYEISQDEYKEGSPSAKDKTEYIARNGYYARRFKTNSLSGGTWLEDVIVLNRNSPGHINYGEVRGERVGSELIENTVSGAIYNTEWLNDQLVQQADGTYHIFVRIDAIESYTTKISGKQVTREHDASYGILTIKNRELVNLD